MNADLLVPGSNAFYLRGTKGNVCLPLLWTSYPSRSVSPSTTSTRAILYYDCPMERLTFPIVRVDPPISKVVRPHCLLLPSSLEQLQPTFRIVLRIRVSMLCRRMTPNIFKLQLSFHQTPWATASLCQEVVQYIGK